MKKVRIGKNQMRPPRVKLLTLTPSDLAVVHRQGAAGLEGQGAERDCNEEHRAWLHHLKRIESLIIIQMGGGGDHFLVSAMAHYVRQCLQVLVCPTLSLPNTSLSPL